jgi:hypothetical protein
MNENDPKIYKQRFFRTTKQSKNQKELSHVATSDLCDAYLLVVSQH